MSTDSLRRALLVEDDALVSMIAEENLSMLGFEPVCARNGAEALSLFAQNALQLAVVDVGLPDIRGDELTLRLRALSPTLPIIVASGWDEAELKAQFAGDPAIAVLPKPYTEEDLSRVVRSLGLTVTG